MKYHLPAVLVACAIARVGAAQTAAPTPLREVMRISGADEDLTSSPTGVIVLRDKRVAIFDPLNAQFVFFDSTGKRVGTFGTKGEGPGEFAPGMGGRIFTLRGGRIGDSVWAYSLGQRRFTLIGPDMKLVRTYNLPQYDAATVVVFTPVAGLSGDRVLGRATFGTRTPITLADGRASTTVTYGDSAIVVLAKDGSVERRIAPAPPDSGMVVINRPGEQYRFAPVPFRRPPFIATSAGGDRIAIATVVNTSGTNGTYRVTVLRTTGETVYSKTFPYSAAPITTEARDSAWARLDTIYGRGRGAEQNVEMLRLLHERTPTSIAPFLSPYLADDGSVWLRKTLPDAAPAEYVVLTPSGTLAPVVRLPGKLRLVAATASTIWATETDGDGFVSIVRLNVAQPTDK